MKILKFSFCQVTGDMIIVARNDSGNDFTPEYQFETILSEKMRTGQFLVNTGRLGHFHEK
jgi:hypothetical protein